MTHIFFRILFGFLAVGLAVTGLAQESDENILTNQQFANARALVRESQEAFVRDELRLTAEEDAAFWPVYRKYRAAMMPTQDRYVALIFGYMRDNEQGVVTDEYAEEMLDDYFSIQSDLLRTRKKYVRQFKKILPMLKVTRFYQLENKLIAEIDAQLALTVPLVDEN